MLDLPAGGSVNPRFMAIEGNIDDELLGRRHEPCFDSKHGRKHLLESAKRLKFHDFEIANLERLYVRLLREGKDEHR